MLESVKKASGQGLKEPHTETCMLRVRMAPTINYRECMLPTENLAPSKERACEKKG